MPVIEAHFFAPDDLNGDTIFECSTDDNFVQNIHLDIQRDKLGSGEVQFARRVPAGGLFTREIVVPEVFVRYLIPSIDATHYVWGNFIGPRQQKVISKKESGGEGFIFGGPGPKFYLTRMILWSASFSGQDNAVDAAAGVWTWPETAKVGRIFGRLLQEEQDNPHGPFLPDLTASFGDVNDSDGVPWTDDISEIADFTLNIQDDYLKILWQLENAGDLISSMNLGTVSNPLMQLNLYQTFGRDLTGAIAADTVHFTEGVNISSDLDVEGESLKKGTHALVRGADGIYNFAASPDFVPGEYKKVIPVDYSSSANPATLNRAGKRALRRQRIQEHGIELKIIPGFDPVNGLYMPGFDGTDGHFWISDTVDLTTGISPNQTELDYDDEAQLVTGIELELTEAVKDGTDLEAARSFDVIVHLNEDRQSDATTPSRKGGGSSAGAVNCNCIKLCRASVLAEFAAVESLGAQSGNEATDVNAVVVTGPKAERVALTLDRSVNVGQSIVVFVGHNDDADPAVAVHDDGGNTYVQAAEHRKAISGNQPRILIFYTNVTDGMTAGERIYFEVDVGSGNVQLTAGSKAISAYLFDGEITSGTESGNGSGFNASPAVSVGGGAFITAAFLSQGAADVITEDGDWTAFDSTSALTQIFGGFRLADVGGESWNGTIDQSRDWAGVGAIFTVADVIAVGSDPNPLAPDGIPNMNPDECTCAAPGCHVHAHGDVSEDPGALHDVETSLVTDETDTELVLHPDGSGGVEWGPDANDGGGGSVTIVGRQALAGPQGFSSGLTYGTGQTLGALAAGVSGAFAVQIIVNAPFYLEGYGLFSGDTATARALEARLYLDSGSATLNEIANSAAAWSFTPSAASLRRVSLTTGAPLLLDPGVYWAVGRNSHATSTFAIRRTSPPTLVIPDFRIKSIGALGSTIDLDTGWTNGNGTPAIWLEGRVLGRTTVLT